MKKFFTLVMLACAAVLGMQAQTENVWVLGNVGDQTWDPAVGTQMTYIGDDTYELTALFNANSYFSFTTMISSVSGDAGWSEIRPYRFGAPANNFEITENLLGEPIECGALGESADNAFLISAGATYKITLTLSDRLVMFERIGDVLPEDPPVDEGHIFIMGEVNGNSWATNVGMMMVEKGNGIFTANVNINAEEKAYFGFTHALAQSAQNWTAVAPFRFAAVDAESQDVVLDTPIALSEDGAGDLSFALPTGKYVITLDMNARTMTVTEDTANHMYIIGNVPFGDWNPSAGMPMDEVAEGLFQAKAVINGDVWFVFSSVSGSWDVVNEFRYGPESTEEDQQVAVGEEVATQLTTGGKSYKITGDGSEYTITFDLNNLCFKFEATSQGIEGDVTGDGTIDIADVSAAINIMLGLKQASDYPGNADVNNSGNVDIADVSSLVNKMLNN